MNRSGCASEASSWPIASTATRRRGRWKRPQDPEARYADAPRVLSELQRGFPRNRILWLEAGATALRAGQPGEAETLSSEGLKRMADEGNDPTGAAARRWVNTAYRR